MRLDWVPWDRSLRPPPGLKDFQQAWFQNLLWASFDQEEMQGYLSISSKLWMIAGAQRRDFFEAHKSAVMACYEIRKLECGTKLLYFPPLIEIIKQQLKRLRTKKSTFPQSSTVRAGPVSSSLSFDFDSEIQNKNLSVCNARAKPVENVKKPSQYTQDDFDSWDLRKLSKELNLVKGASVGGDASWEHTFATACRRAGLTVKRGMALMEKTG